MCSKWLKELLISLAVLGIYSGSAASSDTKYSDVEQWLNKYHDRTAEYVVFPNGQIFTARAKRTGIVMKTMHLWHCWKWMPLSYQQDADVYLRARVVSFLNEGHADVAAAYDTQCALEKFAGDPRTEVTRVAITSR